jgi:signal transduction histidine kinase
MTAVLAVVLAAGVIILERQVLQFSALLASQQLKEKASALGQLIGGTIANSYRPIASDSAVHRALKNAPPASRDLAIAKTLLLRLVTANPANDSGAMAELRTSDGRVIARVGDTLVRDNRSIGAITTGPDSVSVGSFYQSAGRVYYWVTMPVNENGTRIGTIASRGRLNNQPESEKTLTSLGGQEGVKFLFKNTDGTLWATLGGTVVDPPSDADTTGPIHTYLHRAVVPGERVVLYEGRSKATPWTMVMELPVSRLSGGTTSIVRRFALFCAVLLALGAVAVWLITRRITAPLGRMTVAAEAMAKGDYTHRVAETGDYEIARLGSSFNRMATEVEAANANLQAAASSAARAQATAEEANAAKANFLAAMSHELRTPLNAIAGYVQLMEMGLRGPLTADQEADLSRIKRSQEYLLGLIEQVLVFTQLEASQVTFNPEDVHVDTLMRDTETMIAPQIRARDLSYVYDPKEPDLTIRADRAKTQQILLNLLTNGAKFTRPGGRLVATSESRNGRVLLKVSDTGAGIPQKMLSQIFEPFVQVDRKLSQPREGVGLGLTISRDLARAMGGDLLVESTEGAGSTFTLVLPRINAD